MTNSKELNTLFDQLHVAFPEGKSERFPTSAHFSVDDIKLCLSINYGKRVSVDLTMYDAEDDDEMIVIVSGADSTLKEAWEEAQEELEEDYEDTRHPQVAEARLKILQIKL